MEYIEITFYEKILDNHTGNYLIVYSPSITGYFTSISKYMILPLLYYNRSISFFIANPHN